MFVYPVCYQIRSDKVLVPHKMIDDFKPFESRRVKTFSFDDYFQMFSSEEFFHHQINDSLVFAVRNQTFSMFFCFSRTGSLHLFNSRSEVTRFLRS